MVSYNASVYTDDCTRRSMWLSLVRRTSDFRGCNAPLPQRPAPLTIVSHSARCHPEPSNWSGRILATTGIDLPLNSRYMGTFAYTAMKQNDQFIPMTVNRVPFRLPQPLQRRLLQ